MTPNTQNTSLRHSRRYTTLSLTLNAGDSTPAPTSFATLQGQSYLSVPVVALIGNSVIRPMGSEGPEFVPVDVLLDLPEQWNGRVIVQDHPTTGSANTPPLWDSLHFGWIFSSRADQGNLKFTVYLSQARAESLGGVAKSVYDACVEGEMVEVSVGCWVTAVKESGTSPSGVPYEWRWVDYTSDHLAMSTQWTGACSNEMGCGGPRLAQGAGQPPSNTLITIQHRLTSLSGDLGDPGDPTVRHSRNNMSHVLTALFSASFSASAAEDASVHEIRGKLESLLYSLEPAFQWVEDVLLLSSPPSVIYSTSVDGDWKFWQRDFTIAEDGSITLADTRIEVRPVMRWEEVGEAQPAPAMTTAASTTTTASGGCSCGQKGTQMSEATTTQTPAAAQPSAPVEPTATAEPTATPATTTTPSSATATPAPATTPTTPSTTPHSLADWLASAPREFQDIYRDARAAQQVEITKLTGYLGRVQTHYTPDQLKTLSLTDLRALAAVCKSVTVGRPLVDASNPRGAVQTTTTTQAPAQPAATPTPTVDFAALALDDDDDTDPDILPELPDAWNIKGLQEQRAAGQKK
jgi:hypothetical protein